MGRITFLDLLMFALAAFVALWCIGMFANWVAHKCPNRFDPPEE